MRLFQNMRLILSCTYKPAPTVFLMNRFSLKTVYSREVHTMERKEHRKKDKVKSVYLE